MFKFNFLDSSDETVDEKRSSEKEWRKAEKINPSTWQLTENQENFGVVKHDYGGVIIETFAEGDVLDYLRDGDESNCILKAEGDHSDLKTAEYEGGLKIWECTIDLINHLIQQNIDFKDKKVLDLGCGSGILGIHALKGDAIVDFQDYNREVLENITVPNVILNCSDKNMGEKCNFYSGDWGSLLDLLSNNEDDTYDYILTSETIYNPENYQKLIEIFKRKLKSTGVVYLAAKSYYFGVGGNTREFEKILNDTKIIKSEVCWKCTDGLQREILKIIRVAGRALHYVFKIGDRKLSSKFYRDILGMKVLRHEEFADGCEAACNGPYANRWSKTIMGYGSEDEHFVLELTFNYPIKSYKLGNDFLGITIKNKDALEKAKQFDWPILPGNILQAPDGYKFYIIDEPLPTDSDPVQKVTLASSNIQNSIDYWNNILGLKMYEKTDESAVFGFDDKQVKLEFKQILVPFDRAEAYGRIAFSCPKSQQPLIDEKIKKEGKTILTPLIELETPGKASVTVIILADPDGHEICFVDDESYRQLSVFDPDGEKLFNRYMNKIIKQE